MKLRQSQIKLWVGCGSLVILSFLNMNWRQDKNIQRLFLSGMGELPVTGMGSVVTSNLKFRLYFESIKSPGIRTVYTGVKNERGESFSIIFKA